MNDEYLVSEDEVIRHHADGINQYGQGAHDPPKPNCISGAIGNARNAALYHDLPGVEEGWLFAAHLYVYLDARQCFSNGNKRAAWLSMTTVFRRMGLRINATPEEAAEICKSVATHRMDTVGFIEWLMANVVDIEED